MLAKIETDSAKQKNELACNRDCMAKKRFCESDKQADERKASNRQCMAKVRSNETVKAADERRAKNRCFMSKSRSSVKPIDTIIKEFLSKVRVGPGCVYYVANQHFNFLKIKNCPIFATLRVLGPIA